VRAVLVLCVLSLASHVSAQDACAEGRVRGADGICCWPGQTFSSEHRLCEGAPRCPEGLVEHGEACIAAVGPAPPQYSQFITAPPIEDAPLGYTPPSELAQEAEPPRTTTGWPARHEGESLRRAVMRHGEDGGLVAAAMVVFDVGWMMGWLVGILDEATGACRSFSGFGGGSGTVSCNAWPLAFIPVGGGVAAGLFNFAPSSTGFVQRSATWALALGVPSVLLQVGGLIMMAVALANEVHDIGVVPLGDGGVRLSFVPAAQSTDVGLSAVLTF
jgi:hypothetical protein